MQYDGVIYHKETLVNLYDQLKQEMNELEIKLKPLEEKMKTLRFIEHFGLESYININKIQDIKFSNKYDYISTGEYEESINAEFNFSYKYFKSINQINHVNFYLKYSSQHTYENRYVPNINCQTKINVTNTNDEYHFDKDDMGRPVEFYVIQDDTDEESWGSLLSKLVEKIEYKGILEFIEFQ